MEPGSLVATVFAICPGEDGQRDASLQGLITSAAAAAAAPNLKAAADSGSPGGSEGQAGGHMSQI